MRDPLKSTLSWPNAGWIVLLAFLALPNCSFDASGLGPPPKNLNEGPVPHTSAIFCDIERVLTRHCATPDDLTAGIRLAAGAVALNAGQTSTIGIDESPEARARCGGQPEAVTFQGNFPEGLPVCINCSVLGPAPATYPTANEACVAKCEDVFAGAVPEVPPDPAVVTFCTTHAKASTNMTTAAPDMCFAGACTEGGMLLPDFGDPRRIPEPVVWTDLVDVAAGGTTGADLSRTAPYRADYDAGASSTQWITRGDAYVEFSAMRNTEAHVVGFARIPSGCAAPCADTTPALADIDYGILLYLDGRYYIVENGAVSNTGPGINGSFGDYLPGERFRITLTDNADGTAVVSYGRVVGTCAPGMPCNVVTFHAHVGAVPAFPFRVDARLVEDGATVTDVRLVYIK